MTVVSSASATPSSTARWVPPGSLRPSLHGGHADREGYWLVAADGGTFAFGDAAQVGNLTGVRFAAPPSSCASTASGKGLLIAAQDGGVFALGDARFFGHAAA